MNKFNPPFPDIKVIGLVGPMGSGKGSAGKILARIGYQNYVLSDIVREEAARLKLPITRSNLQDIGNNLRRDYGSEILAKRTVEKIINDGTKKAVIDGIRNPAEAIFLKQKLAAVIIGIDAPVETRIKRILAIDRSDYPKTEPEAKLALERDLGKGEKSHGQQVAASLAISDKIIDNSGSLRELQKRILEAVSFYK